MDDQQRIPSPIIGLLGNIFSDFYTHSDIDRLFAFADAPDKNIQGNKVQKTVDWLRATNKEASKPLDVLGALLEDILEKEPFDPSKLRPWENEDEPEWSINLRKHQEKIKGALDKHGLSYSIGGNIGTGSASPIISLKEAVAKDGLSAIQIEMDRALKMVSSDPNAAAHYAGNILEASLKAYLNRTGVPFNDSSDTLSDLWQTVRDHIGLRPKDLESKDLKKIASGLNSIVDGTMYLRNKKSGAHGKTEEQAKQILLRPRHARLVVHSAHTLSMYVLECIEG